LQERSALEKDASTERDGSKPASSFSYDILDQAAVKISAIIAVVQQKCLQSQPQKVARELFEWAERLRVDGKHAEAEFLYLHALNLCYPLHQPEYPFIFTGLRDFVRSMLDAVPKAENDKTNLEIIEQARPIIERNAA
jgi:hypothetical protein